MAEHWFPLRLRCCRPLNLVYSSQWRSAASNHRFLMLHSDGKLASLRRNSHRAPLFPIDYDRPNPHRARPTFCPLRPNPVLRALVLAQWPRLSNCARFPRKPFWGRPRTVNLSIPCLKTCGDPVHDPLCRSHLVYRHHPFILYPCWTPYPIFTLFQPHSAIHSTNPLHSLFISDFLPHLYPFRHLRRFLQLVVLSPDADTIPIRFFRNSIGYIDRKSVV